MEKCSYFIKDKALFGSYPDQESVTELEKIGVRWFVDLTYDTEEKITKYNTQYTQIKYPIVDRKIPTNWKTFSQFILRVTDIIKSLQPDEKIYVHCKGGHGRAGVVVACLLCYVNNIPSHEALELTGKYHNLRPVMRDKWRRIGSPQTYQQRNFVKRFFEPLYFYRAYKTGITVGLSNFSQHTVKTALGTFPTSEAAFQAYKNPNDEEYVEKQRMAKTPIYSKKIGRKCDLREDWYNVRDNIMKDVLMAKYTQNPDIKYNLLNTGLRPLVEKSNTDNYWGCGMDYKGYNQLGKILTQIREDFYREEL